MHFACARRQSLDFLFLFLFAFLLLFLFFFLIFIISRLVLLVANAAAAPLAALLPELLQHFREAVIQADRLVLSLAQDAFPQCICVACMWTII